MSAFLQRKFVAPMRAQLRQGATPDKLALSVAMGFVISLAPLPFPFTTTSMGVLAGWLLRLNHVVLQLANWAAYPLQLVLLVPFCRLGERVFGAEPVPLDPSLIVERFRAGIGSGARAYGGSLLMGTVTWAALAAPAAWLIYQALRPLVFRLKRE